MSFLKRADVLEAVQREMHSYTTEQGAAAREALGYLLDTVAKLPAMGEFTGSKAHLRQVSAQNLVTVERALQLEKWGPQDTNAWPEWMSILTEEVGELAEAINETHFRNAAHPERGGLEKIRHEAVQVAAVAVAIVEATLRMEADHEA